MLAPTFTDVPQCMACATNQRPRVATQRVTETVNQAVQAQAARVAAKEKQVRRAEARSRHTNSAVTVEQDGDSETIRRLKRKYLVAALLSYFISCLQSASSSSRPNETTLRANSQISEARALRLRMRGPGIKYLDRPTSGPSRSGNFVRC
jgi:hypothetical protein